MAKNNPVKQHTLPKVYLNGFTNDEGLLYVYDTKTQKFLEIPPKTATIMKDFYTFETDDGKNYSIEKLLGTVESNYREVIGKILETRRITTEQKEFLSIFLAFQHLRTSKYRNSHNQFMEDSYKKITEMTLRMHKAYYGKTNLTKKHSLEDIDKMIQLFEDEEIKFAVPKENHLKFMMEFVQTEADILMNQNWYFTIAGSNSQFITSDHPFYMSRPIKHPTWAGVGLATQGSSKFFPLHHQLGVMIRDFGNEVGFSKLDRVKLRSFNWSIALNSQRYVFSKNKPLLQRIIKKIFK